MRHLTTEPLIPLQGQPSDSWVAYVMHHLFSVARPHGHTSVGSRPGGVVSEGEGEYTIGFSAEYVHSV